MVIYFSVAIEQSHPESVNSFEFNVYTHYVFLTSEYLSSFLDMCIFRQPVDCITCKPIFVQFFNRYKKQRPQTFVYCVNLLKFDFCDILAKLFQTNSIIDRHLFGFAQDK